MEGLYGKHFINLSNEQAEYISLELAFTTVSTNSSEQTILFVWWNNRLNMIENMNALKVLGISCDKNYDNIIQVILNYVNIVRLTAISIQLGMN